MKKLLLVITLFLGVLYCHGKIWLPAIVADNMVLQQNSTATIWGWTTKANESIKITGSWNNVEVSAKAYQGVWSVQLPTPVAGGPYTISIKGHEEIVLNNILIGEVWICSGQSNMEWNSARTLTPAKEIESANYPQIRFFQVDKRFSLFPQDDLSGNWMVCSPETMTNFSAVAYFFGRKLHADLSVPIGLLSSNWGGTPVETWIPKEILESDVELKNEAKKIVASAGRPGKPGAAYNVMIHPITKFAIAGAIWYQGESNTANPFSYYKSFPLLINTWRELWKHEFPFYFVQIAPYKYDSPEKLKAAIVRDAQLYTMQTVANTGMALTNDIGNLEDIHPRNKQEVGRRLALWALAKTYGVKNVAYCGPIYKSMEISKNKVILSFSYADNGLMKKGEELNEFFVAGNDQVFYPAKAKIVGNKVELTSKKVKKPVAARFAFTNGALPNLYNTEGLPASAFRTDDWEIEL